MQYVLYGIGCNDVRQIERRLYRIWFPSDTRRLTGQKATHTPQYSTQHSRRCTPESGGWPEPQSLPTSRRPTDGQTLTLPQDQSEPTRLTTESSQCPAHRDLSPSAWLSADYPGQGASPPEHCATLGTQRSFCKKPPQSLQAFGAFMPKGNRK